MAKLLVLIHTVPPLLGVFDRLGTDLRTIGHILIKRGKI